MLNKITFLSFIIGLFIVSTSAGLQQKKPSPAVMDRGKKIYEKECLGCHQVDGAGTSRMNPPLIKTKWVTGPKEQLIKVVMKGVTEPLTIGDDEYYNPMPAHTYMTDQEISDVLTFVRNSFGNKASSVSVNEVKAVRAKLK